LKRFDLLQSEVRYTKYQRNFIEKLRRPAQRVLGSPTGLSEQRLRTTGLNYVLVSSSMLQRSIAN